VHEYVAFPPPPQKPQPHGHAKKDRKKPDKPAAKAG
jgi:hypothetical protein